MSEDIGQRGKVAEKKVENVLKKWNDKAGFAYSYNRSRNG